MPSWLICLDAFLAHLCVCLPGWYLACLHRSSAWMPSWYLVCLHGSSVWMPSWYLICLHGSSAWMPLWFICLDAFMAPWFGCLLLCVSYPCVGCLLGLLVAFLVHLFGCLLGSSAWMPSLLICLDAFVATLLGCLLLCASYPCVGCLLGLLVPFLVYLLECFLGISSTILEPGCLEYQTCSVKRLLMTSKRQGLCPSQSITLSTLSS